MRWGLKGEALLPPSSNKIRRRKDARNEMRADVLDYVGFGTMQLGFTIFTKLFHSVQFSLLWSFLRKLLRRRLTAQTNPKLSRFGFVLRTAYAFFLTIRRSGFLNGQCPGERTDRAGLCKAHKARLCELGANPRRLPRPEDLKYIINIFV